MLHFLILLLLLLLQHCKVLLKSDIESIALSTLEYGKFQVIVQYTKHWGWKVLFHAISNILLSRCSEYTINNWMAQVFLSLDEQ